jgi:3-dehydroquinate synthase
MARENLTVGLGDRAYPIVIGHEELVPRDFLEGYSFFSERCLIITNRTVDKIYGDRCREAISASGRSVSSFAIEDGERFKNQETLGSIYDYLIGHRIDRSTTIVALGGGVVGDVAGFAAATYQRGVPLVQVPTTLLSQVDSSVGGKTAINHPLGKNMIGAFYQPKLVIIATETLSTLPEREFIAGLAEVIKYGLIMDRDFFSWLELNCEALLAREPESIAYAIRKSCSCKAEIVAKDETEAGIRALLNYGHTFGHAIEAGLGFGAWLHGEAVAAGMVLATRFSSFNGDIPEDDVKRVVQLLEKVGLPVKAPGLGVDRYLDLMGYDKKVRDGKMRLVLLKEIGSAYVTSEFSAESLNEVLAETDR